jgi:hypothetical protein
MSVRLTYPPGTPTEAHLSQAPVPSPGQRVASHPDILRSILSLCDRFTLVRCLRVDTSFLNQSGKLLYRVLDLSTRQYMDIPKIFLGADDETLVDPKAKSRSGRNFKRRLLGHVKKLYLLDSGNFCDHPSFKAACKSLPCLDHLHFTDHHPARTRPGVSAECARSLLSVKTVSLRITKKNVSLDKYRKLTSAAETLSIVLNNPILESPSKLAAIIDKLRCPGRNRLLALNDLAVYIIDHNDASEQYLDLLHSLAHIATACLKLGIEVYFLGDPRAPVFIDYDGAVNHEPDTWMTPDKVVQRQLKGRPGSVPTTLEAACSSIGSRSDFIRAGLARSVSPTLGINLMKQDIAWMERERKECPEE